MADYDHHKRKRHDDDNGGKVHSDRVPQPPPPQSGMFHVRAPTHAVTVHVCAARMYVSVCIYGHVYAHTCLPCNLHVSKPPYRVVVLFRPGASHPHLPALTQPLCACPFGGEGFRSSPCI
jgi:hypothetical protein